MEFFNDQISRFEEIRFLRLHSNFEREFVFLESDRNALVVNQLLSLEISLNLDLLLEQRTEIFLQFWIAGHLDTGLWEIKQIKKKINKIIFLSSLLLSSYLIRQDIDIHI